MQRLTTILLFAGLLTSSLHAQNFRSYDGRGNNLNHPEWGAVNAPLVLKAGVNYADGMAAPTGTNRPNPRTITNMLFNQPDLIPDAMKLSDYCWAFGQFLA